MSYTFAKKLKQAIDAGESCGYSIILRSGKRHSKAVGEKPWDLGEDFIQIRAKDSTPTWIPLDSVDAFVVEAFAPGSSF
jgi:hypothetical protein